MMVDGLVMVHAVLKETLPEKDLDAGTTGNEVGCIRPVRTELAEDFAPERN